MNTSKLTQSIPANANDLFISVPEERTIDLGATIELDDKGYPTPEAIETLYDEMDFQGAVSAYLQTLPQMNLYGSLKMNHYYGAKPELWDLKWKLDDPNRWIETVTPLTHKNQP